MDLQLCAVLFSATIEAIQASLGNFLNNGFVFYSKSTSCLKGYIIMYDIKEFEFLKKIRSENDHETWNINQITPTGKSNNDHQAQTRTHASHDGAALRDLL
jgi:hypothetical protein